MSSMPESTNRAGRINDNTDFRDGYAEGFLDAVTTKHVMSSDTALAMANLAAGRDDLTAEQRTVILAALDAAMSPAAKPADCPDWCVIDHIHDDERDDLVLHQGDDHIDSTGWKLLGEDLSIRVSRTDSTAENTTGTPVLYVAAELELTTWEQAAELARAILDGFGYLKGA